MNPFDDAVHDLLSSAPEPTPMERLRARISRRRRRRAITIVATTTVVLAGSIGVAASLGRDQHNPVVAISPTTPSSDETSTTSTTLPPATRQSLQNAVDAWATFPVDASPRPIVLTGDRVSAPDGGFVTGDAKEAFLSGAFTAPAAFPSGPAESLGFSIVSAADAFAKMRDEGTPAIGAPAPPTPLIVTNVTLGTSSFQTDRGTRPLPAWLFSFEGVQHPAAVLAVAPTAIFREQSAGAGGVSAKISADGLSLTIGFVGAMAGPGPCSAEYAVDHLESATAVAVEVREIKNTKTTYTGPCSDVGYSRHVTITLDAPLGNRVVVDGATKAAAPVSS